MIQRIQSLFFFAAAIAFASLYVLPFATSSKAEGEIYQNMTLDLQDNIGLLSLTIAGAVLSLLIIFLFNNRKLQSSLGYLSLVIGLALAGLAFYLYSSSAPSTTSVRLGIGMGMPVLAAAMALVGSIFTKKDEKLVKSMDRLR